MSREANEHLARFDEGMRTLPHERNNTTLQSGALCALVLGLRSLVAELRDIKELLTNTEGPPSG